MSESPERERADYDGTWKQVIEVFLADFLELFFPAVRALIDWSRPPAALDAELQQIFPASETGRRYADKLFKAWLIDGREVWVLIHIEVQSQEDPDFAERMYVYHYRLFDRYRRPVVSLAVLGDENASWRPQAYRSDIGGCRLQLEFPTAKLLDYDEATLRASRNPCAVVTAAHLRAKRTTGRALERQQGKIQIARELFHRGYSRKEIVQLLQAIDRLLALPAALQAGFEAELRAIQEEVAMPILMELEERALERGREEGLQTGREEGLQTGREEGACQETVAAILEILALRFEAEWQALGEVEQGTWRDRLAAISTLETLRQLRRQVVTTDSLANFGIDLEAIAPEAGASVSPDPTD